MGTTRFGRLITRERVWGAEYAISGVVGSMIAGGLVRAAYTAIRKRNPRAVFDLDSDEFSWSAFVTWAVAGGIGLGTAKLLSHRAARMGWTFATGTAPPTERDTTRTA